MSDFSDTDGHQPNNIVSNFLFVASDTRLDPEFALKRRRFNFLWGKKTLQFSYHLDLPVDVPLLHVAEAPGLDSISSVGVHPDQTIIGDSDELLLLSALEPAQQRRHSDNMKLSVHRLGETCEREGMNTGLAYNGKTYLARKWVIPNSGRDCHAWMKRILASMRLIWATFWWASRIRAEIW